MAFTETKLALIVATLGLISFTFGVLAEINKPAGGKYTSSPTIVFCWISFLFLLASSMAGWLSIFCPYKGKTISNCILFKSINFTVFFCVALSTSAIGATFLLWLTIIEQLHLSCNIRGNPDCSTAEKGLIGGAALVSLDASLFWLVLIMLALNAKEDYFDDDTEEVPVKGGDDHAITIETNKIDVLDDMENFNGENHQIITIETDEVEDSARITEGECIKSIANVEVLDDVQDDLILDEISHSITTEANGQDHLLHNTQDDSKSETITLENNASVEFIDDAQEDVISHGGTTETNAKEVLLDGTQDESVKTENDHTVIVNPPVSEPSRPENVGAEGIEYEGETQEEKVGKTLESNEGTEEIEFGIKSQEENVGRPLESNEEAEGIEFDIKSQEENVGRTLESNEGAEGIEFDIKSQENVGRILDHEDIVYFY